MRLAKPVVVAFELAAVGGAALVLSGSAWAADSSLGTNSQSQTQTASTQQQTSQSSQDVTLPVSGIGADPLKPADGAAPENAADQNKTSDQSKLGATGGGTSIGVPAPGVKVLVASEPGKVSASDTAPRPTQSQSAEVATVAQSATAVPPANDGAAKLTLTALPVMTYRTAVLPLQPTITSSGSGAVNDLASTVPTPPKPDKTPVPAKSSGALGRLTAELASVTVPLSYALPAAVAVRMPAVTAVWLLLLVMLAVFVFSYGLWLRRGGFATAARSDSPLAVPVLYLLHHSWVMSQRRRANGITHFLVSEPAGVHVMGAA